MSDGDRTQPWNIFLDDEIRNIFNFIIVDPEIFSLKESI